VTWRHLVRRRDLVALLLAEVVSMTGTQMTWLALPWFVLTTTGSARRMAFVMAAEAIGALVSGLPSGTLLARLGARRSMLVADAARAPLLLAVPLCYWGGILSFPLLLALVFAAGAFSGPYFSAQRVIVPELVGEDERLVSQATAFFQGATRITMLLGPALAGVLIAAFSAPSVIVIDAATYVVSFVVVRAGVARREVAPQAEEARGVAVGFRVIARDPLLRGWLVAFMAGDAAWTAFFVTVPFLVVHQYGADPKIAGWILAAFGVGAVVGNVGSLRVTQRFDALLIASVAVLGQALPLWVLSARIPAAAVAATIFVSGVANGFANPSIHALLTLRVPPALRPKVVAAATTIFVVSAPIGLFIAGPALDALGAHPVLVGFALVQTVSMAAVATIGLRARAARSLALEAA
jgi:predicted MFS family arabinose efflux permease